MQRFQEMPSIQSALWLSSISGLPGTVQAYLETHARKTDILFTITP
jgi:hypothetical protein